MPRRFWVGTAVVFGLAAGCAEPDTIATYKVPKTAPVPESVKRAVTEYRVLGAIIPAGKDPATGKDQFWFFLVQGKSADLAPYAEAFVALMKSLKFPDGVEKRPTWSLPRGWEEFVAKDGNAVRKATFWPNGPDHGLEISMTQFGGDLLGNVNRWRGKVGLPEVDPDDLPSAAPAFKVETGQTGYLVDASGKKDPTKGGMPGMGMRPGG
jgi:hypothetical protein